MEYISKMPREKNIQHIYEYNPEHREKMYWVLKDIRDIQYCDICSKIIMKYVYSRRRSDVDCCSMECVDRLF